MYNQQSTSTLSSTRATSLDIYNTHHIFIQNKGPNTTEESTSTGDEEEEEESSYAQSSKETEREDTTKLNTTANSGSSKITCYKCGWEGHIAQNSIYSTKLNGEQITHPSSTGERDQSHATTDGMIGNWDDEVDEEGYGCLFIQHQQKLPSIVNKPKPKEKEK